MQPPTISSSAWEIPRDHLTGHGPSETVAWVYISLEGRGHAATSSHLVGDPPERLGVLDHDAPAPGLHSPSLPEPLHRPANGDALGSDHQGELFMGVVGAEAIASFAGHDPLCLHQLNDEASQPGRHLLEGYILDPPLVEGEALGEKLYSPYAQLGVSLDESVEGRAIQEGDL